MNQAITNSSIRFFLLWAVQVFVLKQVVWGWGGEIYLQAFLYPLFILLLPLRTPRSLVILLGFLLGIAVDWFYESPGMHAGALVFTGFARASILKALTPREGYGIKAHPTPESLGNVWFFRYAALLMLVHVFIYFSLEAFTFVLYKTIFLKLVLTWAASMFFLGVAMLTTNPEA